MNNLRHPLPKDPFETLIRLTAAAFDPTWRPVDPKPRTRWLDRLDGWLWKLRQRDLERSLAGATDLVDLEHRLRALERPARYPER